MKNWSTGKKQQLYTSQAGITSNPAGKYSLISSFSGGRIQGYHILLIGFILYILGFLFGWSANGINIVASEGISGESIHGTFLEPAQSWKLIRDIILNNLGLNSLILIGAFSLLAFSLIIISFNAVQIGFLLKGLYMSFGIKTALILVMPHLVFEVLSQVVSLYLAYLLLNSVIMSLICRERMIHITCKKILGWIALLIAMVLCTFIGAWIEIEVTPGLL